MYSTPFSDTTRAPLPHTRLLPSEGLPLNNEDMIISLLIIAATLDPLATDVDQSETLRLRFQGECRYELNLQARDLDSIGPALTYNLRRCITEKLNDYEFTQKQQRDAVRKTSRMEQLQSRATTTQARLSRRLIERQQQQLWEHIRSQMRGNTAEVQEKILSERVRIRTEVKSRDSTYEQQITQRRSAMIRIRQSCSSSYGEEHQTCVQTQMLDLNLLDQ